MFARFATPWHPWRARSAGPSHFLECPCSRSATITQRPRLASAIESPGRGSISGPFRLEVPAPDHGNARTRRFSQPAQSQDHRPPTVRKETWCNEALGRNPHLHLLICVAQALLSAAEYHVSSSGHGGKRDTRERPLRSIMAAARRPDGARAAGRGRQIAAARLAALMSGVPAASGPGLQRLSGIRPGRPVGTGCGALFLPGWSPRSCPCPRPRRRRTRTGQRPTP